MKRLLLLLCVCSAVVAQDISGFWKSVNDDTKKTQCIVAMYEYKGKYYGRIVATCDKNGVIDDTIYKPKGRAPGIVGQPFYAGRDLLWDLKDKGDTYKGKIVDPEKGNVYNAEVWIEIGGNLIVRGELLFFGRNVTWYPTTMADFKNFK